MNVFRSFQQLLIPGKWHSWTFSASYKNTFPDCTPRNPPVINPCWSPGMWLLLRPRSFWSSCPVEICVFQRPSPVFDLKKCDMWGVLMARTEECTGWRCRAGPNTQCLVRAASVSLSWEKVCFPDLLWAGSLCSSHLGIVVPVLGYI